MLAQEELVILVDDQDNEIGMMEKLEAHRKGLLHRAISVFVFNTRGEMLLQQRAASKYHSPLLWTNASCSHPRQNEATIAAAKRRLGEEMGMIAALSPAFSFMYHAALGNGLTEHEYDHVFTGICDDAPRINEAEVASWRYVSRAELEAEITAGPQQFTEWFKICMKDYSAYLWPAAVVA